MADGELLLEVRCEEIPARMLVGGIEQLGSRLFEELMAARLTPSQVDTGFTPRRLVVVKSSLARPGVPGHQHIQGRRALS